MDEHCMTARLNQVCMPIAPSCALQSALHALLAALLLGEVAAAAGVRGLQVSWIYPDSPAAGHMHVQPYFISTLPHSGARLCLDARKGAANTEHMPGACCCRQPLPRQASPRQPSPVLRL